MSSFTLTQRAKADLREIARFTEKSWGRAQRNIYIKQFDDMFHMLADTPSVGQGCDYIKPNYQKFPQGSHIIFYQTISRQNIQIIRILHKNMDVITKLGSVAHNAKLTGAQCEARFCASDGGRLRPECS